MGDTIQLAQQWVLGSQIGKGGFGRVHEAVGADGCHAAVKLIPKEPGADRELLFEDLTNVRCVVPIIDSGEWEAYWVLVMPRAAKSLRDHLKERGTLQPEEAVAILSDIGMALADLHGKVVHRDIKPENVLLLDGRWCLSDFGIARYAEASTAPDTRKWVWTAAYNPPERWRSERAVPASDIYSLGVMAFEILVGRRPFLGPDFRVQHLTEDAPALPGCPTPLASLVTECLHKAPAVRPNAAHLLERLRRVLRPSPPGAGLLQEANQAHVRRSATEAAVQSAARSAGEQRREMISSATKALEMVAQHLGQSICDNAPAAVWQGRMGPWFLGSSVTLGQATLSFNRVEECPSNAWGPFAPKFQVICCSAISVQIPPDRSQYEGRSHSLWFCDAKEPGLFRWCETAFTISVLTGQLSRQEPFALPPGKEAGKALGPVHHILQVAWPLTPIEPDNDADFIERWLSWFAKASQGKLGRF